MKTLKLLHALILLLFLFQAALNAQTGPGKQIPNLLSAVKAADPGDYILLPSGKKYVLTAEEIAIARGEFDYQDLSKAKTETRNDGTAVKIISEAHVAYIYPDGQSTHLLKTDMSFTAYMRYIDDTYHIGRYIDKRGNYHDSAPLGSARFKVFRASVQHQTISDGKNDVEQIVITAYNHQGKSFIMQYFSKPGFVWGNAQGDFKPVGKSRDIEFDIE